MRFGGNRKIVEKNHNDFYNNNKTETGGTIKSVKVWGENVGEKRKTFNSRRENYGKSKSEMCRNGLKKLRGMNIQSNGGC